MNIAKSSGYFMPIYNTMIAQVLPCNPVTLNEGPGQSNW